MFVLFRAVTYATLFIGLLLVLVPQQILEQAGIKQPLRVGPVEAAGLVIFALGTLLALWCVLTFALIGRGTPAPFDPPRRLVVAGAYRLVRNPMYIGAGLVLLGAAMYYGSIGLVLYAVAFWSAAHLFVLFYEEPALQRRFGAEYDEYKRSRRRWIPRWRS